MFCNESLKELIEAKGLSRREVAQASGYSIHAIQSYLLPVTSKRRRNLSKRTFEAISAKISKLKKPPSRISLKAAVRDQ